MKVAFFHGLESAPYSEKNVALEDTFDSVWAPPMNYRESGLFDRCLQEIKKIKPDLLIGSSMGGWFAYNLSTLTGIPAILFNPAVHSRSFNPQIKTGNKKAEQLVILGNDDEVINPEETVDWFSRSGIGYQEFHREKMGHRIPVHIFKYWLEGRFVNEEWSTESPTSSPDTSFAPDSFGMSIPEALATSLVPNFLTARPPVGTLTVEDSDELLEIKKIQNALSDIDPVFIMKCDQSPPEVFYQWLVLRGLKPSMKELTDLWKNPDNTKLISDLKSQYRRPRPYAKFSEVNLIPGITTKDWSFPSGHACGAMFMACVLSKKWPHLSEGLQNLAHQIAQTRVQAGVHYPSDVEAGKIIGKFLANQ